MIKSSIVFIMIVFVIYKIISFENISIIKLMNPYFIINNNLNKIIFFFTMIEKNENGFFLFFYIILICIVFMILQLLYFFVFFIVRCKRIGIFIFFLYDTIGIIFLLSFVTFKLRRSFV